MAQNKPSISLTIELASGATRVLELETAEPIMVGTGSSAHVRLEGEEISSLHCMIKSDNDGRVTVLDLGSDEGTSRNGKELTGETELNDGDRLQVGRASVTVHLGGAQLAPTLPIRASAMPPPPRDARPPAAAPPVAAPPVAPSPKAAARGAATAPPAPRLSAAPAPRGTPPQQPEKHMAFTKPPAVPSPSARTERAVQSHPRHAHPARRTMAETHGQAGRLSPALGPDEKAQDKGNVDVTLMWGGTVIGVERIRGAGVVTIGPAAASTFQVNDTAIPLPAFPVVSVSPAGAVVQVAPQMQATVDGTPVTGTVTLDLGQECRVRVGPLELIVQYSKRYRPIDMGLFQTLDFLYTKIFALALILQVGLAIAFLMTPALPNLDDDDLFKNQNDFTKLILRVQEVKKEKKDLAGKKAAQHKDDAGVFGKKDKPKEDKVASKKGAPVVDKDKREEDRKIAMDALAALGLKGPEGAVSNVFGPGGLGTGINNALGGLKGSSMGDAGGAGGLGSRGTGAGGGGNALGIGGLGSGTGRGSGGNGDVNLGGRGKSMTRIVPGKITYEGGLTREEIQRVVGRAQSSIKYCYEKELTKDPNLEGKLLGSWTVGATGDVVASEIAQNTFSAASSGPIQTCVLAVIKRMKFPQPRGGGQVFVSYPWIFSGSGS